MKHQSTHLPLASALLFTLLGVTTAVRADSLTKSATITTWNIEHLGSNGRGFGGGYGGFGRGSVPLRKYPLPRRDEASLKKVAAFIHASLQSEVIALQEIGVTGIRRGRAISHPLMDIIAQLNSLEPKSNWQYFIPQVLATPPDDAEDNTHLAFLWNHSEVRLKHVFEMPLPNQVLAGKDLFERTPLVGYFATVLPDGTEGNDFVLVNVHLASGQDNDENHLIAMTLLEYELSDALAAQAINEEDVVILGDLNDNPYHKRTDGTPRYSQAMHAHMAFKGYTNLVSPTIRTTRVNSRLDSLIDHVLANDHALEHLGDKFATPTLPPGGLKKEKELIAWRTTFSDHFPLSFEMKVTPDEDADFFD